MKLQRFIIMLFALVISLTSFSQIGLFTIGEKAVKDISKNKKEKLANKFLVKQTINDEIVPIMRVPEDKFSSDAKSTIIKVQEKLEAANQDFQKNIVVEIQDISILINKIHSIDPDWVITYYDQELAIYKIYMDKRERIALLQKQREKKIQDSLHYAQWETQQKHLKKEQDYKDSIQNVTHLAEKMHEDSLESLARPYLLLQRNLQSTGTHSNLTVFCGIDVNFANMNLSSYLQEFMKLTSVKYNSSPNLITDKYIPKISTNNDYLLVKYFTKKTQDKPFLPTDDGKCTTITKCEISGTADLVIDLFLNYWPQRLHFGGYNQGEILHFQLMGDRVALHGVSPPKTYKIVISEDNVHFNYHETFNIK